MTWSYDDALATARDRVRVMVGDVDTTDQLISDEAIAMYLPGGALGQSSERLAAAEVAVAIATRFNRKAMSMSEGGTSVNWGDRAKRYSDLALSLRAADTAGDDTGLFDWAEQVDIGDPFAARERLVAEVLRSGM